MSMISASRRKAKKIGNSEDAGEDDDREVSFVKRPTPKNKRVSTAKVSFGGESSTTDDGFESVVVKPKKISLGRQTLERSTLRRPGPNASFPDNTAISTGENTRPSYSKEYLAELKNSTPSTPKSEQEPANTGSELEPTSKIGSNLAIYQGSGAPVIPTDVEIQEKKARRARLANEEKYGQDSDSESDRGRPQRERRNSDEDEFLTQRDRIALNDASSAKPSKYGESRLVRDDEDFMEDFDDFVDAGQISMGRRAEKLQKSKERNQIRELIDEAEDLSSNEDSSDSEVDARKLYEAAQTKRGMEGKHPHKSRYERERTPPKITPLSTLLDCKEKWRTNLQGFETNLEAKLSQMKQVENERREIKEREKDIQQLLDETTKRYNQLVASGVLKAKEVDIKLLKNDDEDSNPNA